LNQNKLIFEKCVEIYRKWYNRAMNARKNWIQIDRLSKKAAKLWSWQAMSYAKYTFKGRKGVKYYLVVTKNGVHHLVADGPRATHMWNCASRSWKRV